MMKRRRFEGWIVWAAVLLAVTFVMGQSRADVEQAHVVLTYLLVVLGGSVSGGRSLGMTLACTAFLLIDFFFQLPYDTLTVGKPLDWDVLLVFLGKDELGQGKEVTEMEDRKIIRRMINRNDV